MKRSTPERVAFRDEHPRVPDGGGMRRICLFSAMLAAMVAGMAQGALVHVYEETLAGGVQTRLSDTTRETTTTYTTQSAPARSGYIFTHWAISTSQAISNRDRLGRAKEVASYTLYEETTLIANYLPADEDSDSDGVADGWEIYWYGDLAQNAASDTDGDGYTFAEELASGGNPLMPDESLPGGIVWTDGELLQYNPDNLQPYTVRSEPEGALFATRSDYLKPGQMIPIPSVSGNFAYWMVDGVRQADRLGRAKDTLSVAMPNAAIEIVALAEDDEAKRHALYWYGDASVSMDSDTDGDGYTFAEELASGGNPLMPDESLPGGIAWTDGDLLQYNPDNLQPYTVRSEPEGALFATRSDYLKPGTAIPIPSVSGNFAYWTVDGVRQADRLGRAKDTLSVAMPNAEIEIVAVAEDDEDRRNALYWYGDASVSMDSDTDGDGYTFAEELASGGNPLMVDESVTGGIVWTDGELLEVNLQPYEQIKGTIVDDEYKELFYSPFAGNDSSVTFGGATTPVVADLDGDGWFDLTVELADGTRRVFLNVGTSGNPQFREVEWNDGWLTAFAAAKVTDIGSCILDTPVVNPVSYAFADVDGDGIVDLLASDEDGRVWYYKGIGNNSFALQHKVWGGSHGGFATGLTIAAIDWDEDGDIDLICGTAEGRLMLLNDPRIGRPVNVTAEAGATSVVLSWNPNVNSRVRGYGIYRSSDSNAYSRVQSMWPLPRYRDEPPDIQDYWYRITGMSRFYTTGNSSPIISESMPTDAIYVQFRPSVWLNDTSAFTETNVEMVVSINNSMGISADGLTMAFAYDPAVLTPVEILPTGLTEGMDFTASTGNGVWTLAANGGEIKMGAGRFLRLVFYVKAVHDVTQTEVSLTAATMNALRDGHAILLDLPQTGKIEIADSHPLVPAVVAVNVADGQADTCSKFALPVSVVSTERLTNFTAGVICDNAVLDFLGWTGAIDSDNLALRFAAKDQHTVASTVVTVTNIVAVDENGFAVTADSASGTVLLTDSNPPVAPNMTVGTWSVRAKSGEMFRLPIGRTSDGEVTNVTVDIQWDATLLSFKAAEDAEQVETLSSNAKRLTFAASGLYGTNYVTFAAASIANLQTNSWVKTTAASGIGANGLAANVTSSFPIKSTVLIVREIGRYSPGDINGDGKLTDADITLLEHYITYLSFLKLAPQLASQYASWKLTGSALTAADVNCDGKVDVNDVGMLKQLIAEWKELNP